MRFLLHTVSVDHKALQFFIFLFFFKKKSDIFVVDPLHHIIGIEDGGWFIHVEKCEKRN